MGGAFFFSNGKPTCTCVYVGFLKSYLENVFKYFLIHMYLEGAVICILSIECKARFGCFYAGLVQILPTASTTL